jgi:hypothetical protein
LPLPLRSRPLARTSSSDRAIQVGADFLARAERAGQPLPANDPDRPAIMRSLQLGLVTRNAEFSSLGIMNREVAMEALLFVHQVFASEPGFLAATRSTTALDILGHAVSADALRKNPSLSPRAWGQFLAYAKTRRPPP